MKIMLKKRFKFIGILLIFVGIFIMITQSSSMTGAVIDLSSAISRFWFFIAVGFIAVGLIILSLEAKARENPLKNLFEGVYSSHGENAAFVMDSSALINDKNYLDVLRPYSKSDMDIYVPNGVLKELKKPIDNDEKEAKKKINRGIRRPHKRSKKAQEALEILSNFMKDKGVWTKTLRSRSPGVNHEMYTDLRKIARTHLGMTRKHKSYLALKKFIEEGGDVDSLEPDLAKDYKRLGRILDEDGMRHTKENKIDKLKKRWRVNIGDLDVLTTGLYLGSSGKEAKIYARDSHIRDAIKSIKEVNPTLVEHVEYIEPREALAAA